MGEGARLYFGDHSTYIKVDETGQVVETGNPVWGKEGYVHWIDLPSIWHRKQYEVLKTDLTIPVDGVEIKVVVSMTVHFTSPEFKNYQELYDKVICDGFFGLNDWIKHCFAEAAKSNAGVQAVFERYKEHESPYTFVEELGNALRQMQEQGKFSGKLLSNIDRIEVQPLVDVVLRARAVFNGT